MWWWFAVALAGPPEGLDLEDPTPWDEASRQLFEGPPGCWEIVGKATWNHDGARFGVSRGSAAFAGRLVDGVWGEDMFIEPLGEIVRDGPRDVERRVYRDDAQPFMPLLGRHQASPDGDGDDVATTALDGLLGELQGEARYTWVKWDDDHDAVIFTEVVPVGDKNDAPEITVDVRFPDGRPLPSRADVTFPERLVVHDFPVVAAKNARVELRGTSAGGHVFPAAEAYSADFGVLGMKFHSAQTIQYRSIRPCIPLEPAPGSDVPALPVPALPPPGTPADSPAEVAPDAETPKAADSSDQP